MMQATFIRAAMKEPRLFSSRHAIRAAKLPYLQAITVAAGALMTTKQILQSNCRAFSASIPFVKLRKILVEQPNSSRTPP